MDDKKPVFPIIFVSSRLYDLEDFPIIKGIYFHAFEAQYKAFQEHF
jgi:hypothetical protein